ncbi:MAG: hypothetical protein CMB82_00395 [Flammeovirgaceae bacterium]|nr:hypothetical protein [Flammeovirgaceae bacterium]|tara:strand:+ start:185 stop:598 length:414 start_codon:yes stop_codon:yes gene_type:complete
MKLKSIFIISGVLTLIMQIVPIVLATLIPSVKEFFIIDGFGESMLQNTEGLVVFDVFISVMGFMGAAIVVPIFGALRIKDLDAQRELSLLCGIMLVLVAMPDYIGILSNEPHAPIPIMILNFLIFSILFYGWKKGTN